MKRIIQSILAAIALAVTAAAQTPAPATVKPTFIKGDMSIRYATRTQTESNGKPKAGVADRYTLAINVCDSALFRGTIDHLPTISSMLGVSQKGMLTYSLDCDVVNPANPSQTRNVGKLYGTLPVDENNVYRFADGSVKVNVFGIGAAKGFESKSTGLVIGRPPTQAESKLAKFKREALSISRNVGGKTVSISVAKYDKAEFVGHVLAAGPVQIYPEVTVNGTLIYDYGRSAWHFQNVTVTYAAEGRQMQDNLTGNIRWVEAPDRKSSGNGEYQFDIRVNEPAASEASVFSGPSDESAFFATDSLVPALTGAMRYKDSFSGETVTASAVTVDLVGNRLTKQQAMVLTKLLFHSIIVPLNAE